MGIINEWKKGREGGKKEERGEKSWMDKETDGREGGRKEEGRWKPKMCLFYFFEKEATKE